MVKDFFCGGREWVLGELYGSRGGEGWVVGIVYVEGKEGRFKRGRKIESFFVK